jgi:cell division septation protein DedD
MDAAARWLRIAAEHGEPTAQNLLGTMYYKGQGVPMDKAEAARWISRAAEQGHPAAQDNLSQMYLRGEGVPQDYAQAEEWARRANAQPANRRRTDDILREPFQDDAQRLAGSAPAAAAPPRVRAVSAPPVAGPPVVVRGAAAGATADLPWLHPGPGQEPAAAEPVPPLEQEPAAGIASAPPARETALAAPGPPEASGYAAQLAAVDDTAAAEALWTELSRGHADLLGGLGHWVERADLGRRGTVFRLRVGPFASEREAQRLCGEFAARRLDCWVANR